MARFQIDSQREDFRIYLESQGIMEVFTKSMVTNLDLTWLLLFTLIKLKQQLTRFFPYFVRQKELFHPFTHFVVDHNCWFVHLHLIQNKPYTIFIHFLITYTSFRSKVLVERNQFLFSSKPTAPWLKVRYLLIEGKICLYLGMDRFTYR